MSFQNHTFVPTQAMPDPLSKLWPFAAVVGYIIAQRLLRFKRSRELEKAYGVGKRSLSDMTDHEAQDIQAAVSNLEFPFVFKKALQFALFRTYGIPSISKLLVKTNQLSNSETAPKRYTDTVVIVEEIYGREPTDPRVREAFGRLNYLHGCYRQTSQISNDDMLYTLNLFAWEPIRWINRFEWRQLTDLEFCAIGTFVKSMGDAMEISYQALPSFQHGFVDGSHWLREMADWAEAYEQRCMVAHVANHDTAEETTALLTRMLPPSLRPFGKNMVITIMDDRLRKAMIYDSPPRIYHYGLMAVLSLRKFLLRYIALPRPELLRIRHISDEPDRDGRYFLNDYDAYPFYVKPTLWNRWGLTAWLTRAAGVPLPGDDGESYRPKGYKIEEIGPKSFLGKGDKESKATQEKLEKHRTGGCPFIGIKA